MVELKIVLSLIISKFEFSLSPLYKHSPAYRMIVEPEHGVHIRVKIHPSSSLLLCSPRRTCTKMGKIWIEVCLISARGLQRSSLLWKLQWFAVGWIEPNNKYCTKVDASGNSNPTWKTKFLTSVDYSESIPDLILNIEVYSREPVFLRERLQGSASVSLKEFMVKYTKDVDKVLNPGSDQVGSFQLRKKNSSKPQGFVDVSVRISEDGEDKSSYPGNEEGIQLMDHRNGNTLANSPHAYPSEIPIVLKQRPGTYPMESEMPMVLQQRPGTYPTASDSGPSYLSPGGQSYQPPQTHLQPPLPSNVGYMPTFPPRKDHVPPAYMNMPSSGRPGQPGFGMGMGAGALTAGALIFGDDFMSGYNVPAGFQDGSLTIATDPPF